MRAFLIAIALVGCGGSSGGVPMADAKASGDATPSDGMSDGMSDAPADAPPDAPVMLNCTSYCAELGKNCIGANAQYGADACMLTCSTFTEGAIDQDTGNTLGCRLHHAGTPAKTAPATECAIAGPGGDVIPAGQAKSCSGDGVCANFCRFAILACGSQDAPLPGNPTDPSHNPLYRYQNIDDCLQSCTAFDKAHAYSTSAMGDSLACRLFEATNALVDPITHCAALAAFPSGLCAGTATP